MKADEAVEAEERDGWFVAAAGVVGDLSNPFYREERQRDVWNEACSVGLQLVLWLGLAAGAAMTWFGGANGLPYAVAVLAVLGAASGVSILYAQHLGVRVNDAGRVLRLRLVPYAVLMLVFLVGVVRAAPSSGFGAGLAQGAAAGGAITLAWLVWSGLRARRQSRGAPERGTTSGP